ncbi:MAG: rhomboid family intramembrane serine protease [Bacteroidales bacterium]|nr:rhomboid family intramembrane serine protease [Bacteroidales bacterium]
MQNNFKIFTFPLIFTIIVILVFLLDHIGNFNLYHLGIYPRKFDGLSGILFSPFIHGDVNHLLSNLTALPFLLIILSITYRKNYFSIFIVLFFLTGLITWIIARNSYHIGSSGIIYALASFIFFGGIVSNKKGAVALSLLIIILYGGMIWGILPTQTHISWESHFAGGFSGFVSAFMFVSNEKSIEKPEINYDYKLPGFSKNGYISSNKYNLINYVYYTNEVDYDYNFKK